VKKPFVDETLKRINSLGHSVTFFDRNWKFEEISIEVGKKTTKELIPSASSL